MVSALTPVRDWHPSSVAGDGRLDAGLQTAAQMKRREQAGGGEGAVQGASGWFVTGWHDDDAEVLRV